MKATNQEGLDFYMFHCFNISEHISTSVLLFIISILCFAFFDGIIFLNNCHRGGVSARFFGPSCQGFVLSLCLWGGSPLQKHSPGIGQGGGGGRWSGLELTDT